MNCKLHTQHTFLLASISFLIFLDTGEDPSLDLANLVLDVVGKVPTGILAEQAPHPSKHVSENFVSAFNSNR